MNSKLEEFFKNERERVIEPDPFFPQRVMAQLKARPVREIGIWDTVFAAAKPVFALALILVVGFLTLEMLLPIEPSRGFIEIIASDQSPEDTVLFSEPDASSPESLEDLLSLELD